MIKLYREHFRRREPNSIKPHFYIEKLGYTGKGVFLFFLFLLQNIDCGYSCTHNQVPTINVLNKNKKNVKKIPVKFSIFTDDKTVYCMGKFIMYITVFVVVVCL